MNYCAQGRQFDKPPGSDGLAQDNREVRMLGRDVRVQIRTGDGSSPPLLICNGIGAGQDLLTPFIDALSPRLDVVTFDVPGAGGSEPPRLPYRFSNLACALNDLMRDLGYAEFDILGISWGGGLAQQVALQHPRRCRRVVLVSTATGMLMVPAGPSILAKMVTPRRYRDPAYATSIAAQVYGGRMRTDPDYVRTLLHPHAEGRSARGYVYQLLAGAGWTSLPWLPLLRQPTLILAGSDDPIIPLVNAKIMARLIPNARLHVFADGHLGLLTESAELAPIVSSFLLTPTEEAS